MGMPKREWLEDMAKVLGTAMVADYFTILALWYRDVEKDYQKAKKYEDELAYFFAKGFDEEDTK